MWGQEAPPPMVSYPELMAAGFPCGDLGKLTNFRHIKQKCKICIYNQLFGHDPK